MQETHLRGVVTKRINVLRPPLRGFPSWPVPSFRFPFCSMVRSWVHSAAFLRQRCPMWEGLRSTNSAQRLLEETRVTVISHKIIHLNATVRRRLWTTMYFDECLAIGDTAWGSTSICRCKEYGIKSYWISYYFSFHASIVDNSIKDCIVICTHRFQLDPFTGNHAAFTHFAQIGGFGLYSM